MREIGVLEVGANDAPKGFDLQGFFKLPLTTSFLILLLPYSRHRHFSLGFSFDRKHRDLFCSAFRGSAAEIGALSEFAYIARTRGKPDKVLGSSLLQSGLSGLADVGTLGHTKSKSIIIQPDRISTQPGK